MNHGGRNHMSQIIWSYRAHGWSSGNICWMDTDEKLISPSLKNIAQCNRNLVFPNIQANPLIAHIHCKGSIIQHCVVIPPVRKHSGPWHICIFQHKVWKSTLCIIKSGWGLLSSDPQGIWKGEWVLWENGEELRDGGQWPGGIFGSQGQETPKAVCLVCKMRVPSWNTWNLKGKPS